MRRYAIRPPCQHAAADIILPLSPAFAIDIAIRRCRDTPRCCRQMLFITWLRLAARPLFRHIRQLPDAFRQDCRHAPLRFAAVFADAFLLRRFRHDACHYAFRRQLIFDATMAAADAMPYAAAAADAATMLRCVITMIAMLITPFSIIFRCY